MNILPYEVDWTETFKVLLAVLAITISGVTIIITKRNIKKQIRASKLEEVMEILSFLEANYNHLHLLYSNLQQGFVRTNNAFRNDYEEYMKQLRSDFEFFEETIGKTEVPSKILRLKVLGDSYLPNDNKENLKLKIIALADMYMRLYATVRDLNDSYNVEHPSFPLPILYAGFNHHLQQELINEMNLGYKGYDKRQLVEYAFNQFNNDITTRRF